MSIGNTKDQGNKGNNFPYQLRTLQLLSSINDGIAALPGVDYETRTTTYQAVCTICGPGYSTGDIIVRYDIIDVATSTLAAEMWFNQTLQTTITPPPAPGDITPISSPSGVTVLNGPAGAAVNIQDGGNSITVDDGGTPLNVQGTVAVNLRDGSGIPISSTGASLDVNVTSPISVSVILNQSTSSVQVYGFDGTNNQPIATDASGNLQVDILSIPTVDVSGSSVTVSGTVTTVPSGTQDVNIVSSVILDVSGSNVLVTGTVAVTQDLTSNPWIVSGTVGATQSGTWTIDSITNPVVVTASGLDIRQLDFLLDSVNVSGSNVNAVVTASALDIRSLTFVTDSVDVSNSTNVGVTNPNLDAQLSTLATEATLVNIEDNVTSKIDRIRGAADYTRVFTYYGVTNNVATIVHTGTTNIAPETLTETFTYQSNLIDGSNVVSIIYSL
jgi:hypothetical protein